MKYWLLASALVGLPQREWRARLPFVADVRNVVDRVVDNELGVVCYVARRTIDEGGVGISCLQIPEQQQKQ